MSSVIVHVDNDNDTEDQDGDDMDMTESKTKSATATAAVTAAVASSSSSSQPSAGNRPNKRRQIKTKGRGFKQGFEGDEDRYAGRAGEFESIGETGESDAQRSVEGWIIVVTGIHEEAQEDDVYDVFADHGEIQQIHLNLDRRTGYVKGYALIEYKNFREAQAAIDTVNGFQLLERPLHVDWAFKRPSNKQSHNSRQSRGRRR